MGYADEMLDHYDEDDEESELAKFDDPDINTGPEPRSQDV